MAKFDLRMRNEGSALVLHHDMTEAVLFVCWAESEEQIAMSANTSGNVDDLIFMCPSSGEGF